MPCSPSGGELYQSINLLQEDGHMPGHVRVLRQARLPPVLQICTGYPAHVLGLAVLLARIVLPALASCGPRRECL